MAMIIYILYEFRRMAIWAVTSIQYWVQTFLRYGQAIFQPSFPTENSIFVGFAFNRMFLRSLLDGYAPLSFSAPLV